MSLAFLHRQLRDRQNLPSCAFGGTVSGECNSIAATVRKSLYPPLSRASVATTRTRNHDGWGANSSMQCLSVSRYMLKNRAPGVSEMVANVSDTSMPLAFIREAHFA
ncbi:hypothetical protein D3C76_542200 [compost metagenome]